MVDFDDLPDDEDDIDLERFEAQQDEPFQGDKRRSIYQQAVAELREGRKRSHWMWFVFPQCDGVPEYHGEKPSEMTLWFGVAGLAEATAYLEHETLGVRLRECFRICVESGERDATAIFGPVDAAKFRASATLFSRVEAADPIFTAALETFFDGRPCQATMALTGEAGESLSRFSRPADRRASRATIYRGCAAGTAHLTSTMR